MAGNSTTFKPGNKIGVKGRPKGIIDKRMRLNKALMGDADSLLEVATAKAREGDGQMLTLLLSRAIAPLKPEGTPVRFAFDADASLGDQFNSLLAAIASGQLTIEEGKQVADMLRARAEIAALEGKDEAAAKLVERFKDLAMVIAQNGDSLPVMATAPAPATNLPPGPPPPDEV